MCTSTGHKPYLWWIGDVDKFQWNNHMPLVLHRDTYTQRNILRASRRWVYVCLCAKVCMRVHVSTCVFCLCVSVCACVCVCMCVYERVCVCVCGHVCMCVCVIFRVLFFFSSFCILSFPTTCHFHTLLIHLAYRNSLSFQILWLLWRCPKHCFF